MADRSEPGISILGIAGAAFACFLVIVSVPAPSAPLLRAAKFFAVGIPVVVAAAVLDSMYRQAVDNGTKAVTFLFRFLLLLIGDISCVIGIYSVFRHVSPASGRLFLICTFVCSLLVAALVVRVVQLGRGESRDPSAAAQPDTQSRQ
jgi:hypothetical protein